jgi:peroxiredoxin
MKPLLFNCLLLLLLPVCGIAQSVITQRGMALPVMDVQGVVYSVEGTRIAPVTITDAAGKSWALHQLQEKAVYLYCFAGDSVVNKEATANLNYLMNKFGDSSVVFLALTPDAFSQMGQCGGNTALKCPVALGQQQTLSRLEVGELPATIILNRKARIALWQDASHTGGLAEQEAVLRKLLRK